MTTIDCTFAHNGDTDTLEFDSTIDGPQVGRWITNPSEPVETTVWVVAGEPFLPLDASIVYPNTTDDDGTPNPDLNWHRARDGRPAILGLAGAPLAILE